MRPSHTSQPSQHCSLPSHPCSWETKNCEKGKYNELNSIFLHSFTNFIRGTNSGDLMQLKPQDSVACVFASFDVIMLFDYFHTPAGQSMPIISPLLLALDYGWIPIRMSPGAVLCVHGCPWASIHGCPWCPWVSIQATAARSKMYCWPLPLCWTPRTTAPFRWMSSRSGVWRSNRTQTGNRVFIHCIGY